MRQWALYCLLRFYHALSNELRGLGALSKFLCVKALVFFTFWYASGGPGGGGWAVCGKSGGGVADMLIS